MGKKNWKNNLAPYIERPLFESYGGFIEERNVLVDCSFGVNPLGGLYPEGFGTLSLDGYNMYPSGGPHHNASLAAFVASRWPGVEAESVCFSAGSQGAIASLAKILGGAKAKVLGYLPQFLPALLEFSLNGAQVDYVRLQGPDYAVNADMLLDALGDDTTAVYVDTPNNPTGRAMDLAEITKLAQGCAKRGVLTIVDEAYADFVDDGQSAMNLAMDNVICLRSFSKGCGLAGLRIGYIVIRDPELRQIYYDLGLHFSCSALAADVAAKLLPSLDFEQMRRDLRALKKNTVDFMLQTSGITICESHEQTPIVLVGWNRDGSLYDTLMDVGILTEPGHFFGIDDTHVRLRIPAKADFPLFCELWEKAFRKEW